MKHELQFILNMISDKRLSNDIKAIRIANKIYVFYTYELSQKTGIMNELKKKPNTINELSYKLGIKNIKMLEALIDFLVGNSILKFENNSYFYTGNIPKQLSISEQNFITKYYKGSEDWTLFLYEFAEKALIHGSTYTKTSFNNKTSVDLWDSVMNGPLFSLRRMAVKELVKGIQNNSTILDYGCGSGTSIMEILSTSKKQVNIMGIDSSAHMLNLAKERLKTIGSPKNVQLIRKDLLKHYDLNQTSDCAFASLLINHIPVGKREQFYQNIANNLKPGGKLVLFQLVNKDKFHRIFSDWLLYVIPSHHGFPFLTEYSLQLSKYFSKVEVILNGMIIVAYK